MTDLRVQRRIAAQVLKCGENRVWIDQLHQEDVASAITREDIRRLVNRGIIEKRTIRGTSRARARKRETQRAKGRQRGPGNRKGAKGARNPKKASWMRRIRALRKELKAMREEGVIDASQYRYYYRRAKGGVYNSRAHLISHLRIDGVLDEAKANARLAANRQGGGS